MNTDKNECKNHKWIPLLGFDKGKNIPTSLFTCLKCGDLKVGERTIKISQYRMDMGGLPIYQLQEMRLKPLTADNTASGLVVTATVDTNAVGIGAPLFMAADGHLETVNADSDTTSPCVALALETGTGIDKRVLVHGILKTSNWSWVIGNGKANLVYISTVTGVLLQHSAMLTGVTGEDDVIQPVGWALSSTSMYFSPSMIYLTHAA